jgi:hypothetical protein
MTAIARPLPPEAALPPCDDRIVKLYCYWLSVHPARGVLPGRQHFDPAEIARLLPWIWLVEFQPRPLRFKYRLIGTQHVVQIGRDPKGKWLDEVHPRFVTSSAYSQFVAAVERGEAGFYKGPPTYHVQKDYMSIERLILPLARNGSDVDRLIGMTVFTTMASFVR